MKVNTFQCDICQTQRKEANHWWLAWHDDHEAERVVIAEWNDVDLVDASHGSAHLCGAECVTQWLSRNLLGAS